MIGRGIGTVLAVGPVTLEARLLGARVGDGVRIETGGGRIAARVTALRDRIALLAPLDSTDGIARGNAVVLDPLAIAFAGGMSALGRALGGNGAVLDGGSALRGPLVTADGPVPAPDARRPVSEPFITGIRAIDGPLALGRGARIGLFGAPGAGKSTLLEAIARGSSADATVVGLIGERGREAERYLSRLDPRTTVICATSDRSAAERVRAAEMAFAQADGLRARGLDVLLIVDSLARAGAALREVAVAAGEPSGRGGFPPSVFAQQAKMLERAGSTADGTVTLVATVLSDGPMEHDPLAEAARAALDGHIVLSRRLADAGRFPAIDIAASASRTMDEIASPAHRRAARILRAAIAALDESRDARAVGLDPAAGNPRLARAVAFEPAIEAYLRQSPAPSPIENTLTDLLLLADRLDDGYSG